MIGAGVGTISENKRPFTQHFFFIPKELWGEPALGFIRFYSINEYSPDYVIGVCLQLRGAVCL